MLDKTLPQFMILALNQEYQYLDQEILENAGITNYNALEASYKGTLENSYLIVINNRETVKTVLQLAQDYNQESVLYVNSEREAILYPTHPEKSNQFLGIWRGVGPTKPTTEAWTFDPKTKTYYTAI